MDDNNFYRVTIREIFEDNEPVTVCVFNTNKPPSVYESAHEMLSMLHTLTLYLNTGTPIGIIEALDRLIDKAEGR